MIFLFFEKSYTFCFGNTMSYIFILLTSQRKGEAGEETKQVYSH